VSAPKAISTGALKFGSAEVDCYNLDDGRRVLSQRGVIRGLTGGAKGGPGAANLARYIDRLPEKHRALALVPVVEFVLPSGTVAHGREADWFVDLCNAYVDAAVEGALTKQQIHLGRQARAIVSACAKTGIAALIDEATGFQYVREHGMLASIFEKALRREAGEWQRRWQDDVVDALCRTFRIQRSGKEFPAPLMGVVGKLYRTILGAEVHDELKRRNPRGDDRDVHTQWMTDDVLSALRDHMEVIKAFAMTTDSKTQFWSRLERYASGGKGQVDLFDDGKAA
jgi:hypothetical protein